MMRRLAIDIETAPIPELLDQIPMPDVACGNLKDPIKIREKCDQARADQVTKAALDPHYGRIISIAIAWREPDKSLRSHALTVADDTLEEHALRWAWDRCCEAGCLVTFNGAAFDIPFMLRRSLIIGVRPVRVPCGKYDILSAQAEGGHLDVCACLHQWEVGQGFGNPLGYKRNLAFYAKVLLGRDDPHPDIDHAELGRLMDAGKVGLVDEINRWDAETTLLLAEKIATVYP